MAETGSPTVDALLEGGVGIGDNIVWVVDHPDDARAISTAFLAVPGGLRRRISLRVVDGGVGTAARIETGSPHDQQTGIEALALGDDVTATSRLVFEDLDDLVLRWGAADAVAFYRRTCPRLFDRGAIAYWMATPEVGQSVIEGVSRIAQCVFEVRGGQFRVIKAEGRPRRLQGATTRFETRSGVPTVSREHALGRLGEGLRRTRKERNLTQAQVASMAGVTPAAISQAETGRRGLSLDTLIQLCETLRLGIDDLLGTGRPPDPRLARHDRDGSDTAAVALFDEPSFGPRTFLLRISANSTIVPPFAHKGPELVLVADGLVLVELDDTTPVLRSGDALRVSRTPVRRLINLTDSVARVFWVVVDPPSFEPSNDGA